MGAARPRAFSEPLARPKKPCFFVERFKQTNKIKIGEFKYKKNVEQGGDDVGRFGTVPTSFQSTTSGCTISHFQSVYACTGLIFSLSRNASTLSSSQKEVLSPHGGCLLGAISAIHLSLHEPVPLYKSNLDGIWEFGRRAADVCCCVLRTKCHLGILCLPSKNKCRLIAQPCTHDTPGQAQTK